MTASRSTERFLGMTLAAQRLSLAMHASRQGVWDLDTETGKIYDPLEWKWLLGHKNQELADNPGLARQLTPAGNRVSAAVPRRASGECACPDDLNS